MSDTVEIALASDAQYFCGLLVTAASIAKFANPGTALSFNILDGGIQDKDYDYLLSCVTSINPKSTFTRHKLNLENTYLSKTSAYLGSKMTYARLLLPFLLPDCDYVIYSDIDILWLADIERVWKLRSPSCPYISSPESCRGTLEMEKRWFNEHGLAFTDGKYFCAGFSFFNLKLFREQDISLRVFDFLQRHGATNCADQTGLNAVLGSQVQLLPRNWQLFPRNGISDSDIKSQVLIHYAGEAPWRASRQTHLLTDTQLLWFRFDALIRGISLWQSLRMHYSQKVIILWRTLFGAISCGLGSRLFRYYMYRSGRGCFNERLSSKATKAFSQRLDA